MHTSHTGIDDRIVWTKCNQGNYFVKNTYYISILPLGNSMSPIQWKLYWKLYGCPKILLFGWKCFVNALPLGSNLLRKHFNIDASCPFCCESIKDDHHPFLQCSLTRAAWFGSTFALRSDCVSHLGFRNWLVDLFSKACQGVICRNLFIDILTFVWSIYNHRNKVRFQGMKLDCNTIIKEWRITTLGSSAVDGPLASLSSTLPRPVKIPRSHGLTHTQNRLFFAYYRCKHKDKNIIGGFHFQQGIPILGFCLCEQASNAIMVTTLVGIKRILELLKAIGNKNFTFYCSKNIMNSGCFSKANHQVETLVLEIHAMVKDCINSWELASTP